jgi:hypothetical protein
MIRIEEMSVRFGMGILTLAREGPVSRRIARPSPNRMQVKAAV